MAKVILKGFIIVPESDLIAVQQQLVNHTQLTMQEIGCLVFEVTQCEKQPCRFDVYEEFTDQAAFEAHQIRVGASQWGRITENVERHYEVFNAGESCDQKSDR